MMDTPAVKFIYSAKIRALKEYNVFMSAVKTTVEAYNATFSETTFHTPIKIQSYLIAIAVGDLIRSPIGAADSTIGVITEPGFMTASKNEFSGLKVWFDAVQE